MKEDFQYVYTHTDQEEVVNIFRKYDLVVLPDFRMMKNACRNCDS